ncbi:SDR family NAD(P)-dependent oxidoreductase [Nocardia brasiliensis]|uniref:SDR family NAD(P)-dependent oxidoreductase n=1 Tax=Nocardia brasiliensis TaxID=37326 RepID=UPI0036704298
MRAERHGAVVVTGGTSGIGRACASELVEVFRGEVIITGTDERRTAAAARDIRAEPAVLDLRSFESIREFAQQLRSRPIRALVCNAGVQLNHRRYTADGIEESFAINYLGHFALIQLLLDQLARPSRIVLVTSGAHDPRVWTGIAEPRLSAIADLAFPVEANEPEQRAAQRSYTTAKLCTVMAAYALSRRYAEDGISINAFDPGLVPATNAARDATATVRLLWNTLYRLLTPLPGVWTVADAGGNLARLITDPELAGVSGCYFSGRHPRASSLDSYNTTYQRDVWEQSLELLRKYGIGV